MWPGAHDYNPPLAGPICMVAIQTSTPIFALRRSFANLQHGVLGLARSAGRLGIPVYTTRMHGREAATRSRYIRGCVELPATATDAQWLDALLGFDTGLGRPVLMPLDDAGAVFTADHQERLAERFVIPKSPVGLTGRLASKRGLLELCHRLELPAPASDFPTSEDEAVALADGYGYPLVLKCAEPRFSLPDAEAPSVLIARTEAELVAGYRRMNSAAGTPVMIQEYIPGASDTVWMFNGYFDADAECLCGFTGRKLRQTGPHTGPTTLGICIWNEAVAEAATRLMHGLRYHGIVDMGFRYDERDGQYKLLDVNPRTGSSFRLFVGEDGIDVVRAAYLDLTDQPVSPTRARDGRRWLDEPHDAVASGLLVREGELTVRRWMRSLSRVDEAAWWASDDPRPFFAMCASLARLGVRYRARRRAAAESRFALARPSDPSCPTIDQISAAWDARSGPSRAGQPTGTVTGVHRRGA